MELYFGCKNIKYWFGFHKNYDREIYCEFIPKILKSSLMNSCIFSNSFSKWWRHQMEAFFAWLALCVGNRPVTGEFPTQRPVTQSFDVFFYLRLNKQLSKQSWGWRFETTSHPLWRHCNDKEGFQSPESSQHWEMLFSGKNKQIKG